MHKIIHVHCNLKVVPFFLEERWSTVLEVEVVGITEVHLGWFSRVLLTSATDLTHHILTEIG